MMRRRCASVMPLGQLCRAAPLHDRPYCFLHDPERAEEAAEARRRGGLRRRREGTLELIYDLQGLDSVEGIRRLLEIVVADALGIDGGLPRLRVLIAAVGAAIKLLVVADHEARLAALEAIVSPRKPEMPPGGLDGGLLGRIDR